MSNLKNYDPLAVTFSYKGIDVTGYQDGTFIDVERAEDSFTKHVGSSGEVARTQIRNRSGKITLTLMMTSPTNDLLMALAIVDEQTGLNYGALQIKDLHGNMQCQAHEAWVMKLPKVERAKEAGSVVWVFECSEIKIFAGGNVI